MRTALLVTLLVVFGNVFAADTKTESPPEEYQRALQLIHAFSGSGNELDVAMQLAERLSKSHPRGGYAEVLRAEAASTWTLDESGQPARVREYVIATANLALSLNPNLAQAYVARARAFARASQYGKAKESVDAALKLDPTLNGAMFMRADIFRRTQQLAEAEVWYLKFIAATPDRARQSNGYFWLGQAYQEAAERERSQRTWLIAKARVAYEKTLELDPDGAWKLVNFAIFLNDHAADFSAAEKYAERALKVMEFPMARYHLAIARYQSLLVTMGAMDDKALQESIAQVRRSTRISFEDALNFSRSYPAIQARLRSIEARLRRK